MKYSKELLQECVSTSYSVAEVLRKLGYKRLDGGTHYHFSRRLKQLHIDTSHFRGKGANFGSRHKGNKKLPWQEILVSRRRGILKEDSTRLRKAMLESGIEHICSSCGLKPFWNSKLLVLQISHKDGNSLNNIRENLQFECPNCHSQTNDFGGRSAHKKSL